MSRKRNSMIFIFCVIISMHQPVSRNCVLFSKAISFIIGKIQRSINFRVKISLGLILATYRYVATYSRLSWQTDRQTDSGASTQKLLLLRGPAGQPARIVDRERERNWDIFSPFLIFLFFQVIGRLELGGGGCSGTALHHWNEVMTSPRRQIAEWHKLQE